LKHGGWTIHTPPGSLQVAFAELRLGAELYGLFGKNNSYVHGVEIAMKEPCFNNMLTT
jgi:hypothetical protein